MNKEEKEIKKILKEAQDYFGKDEKIYIFKCKKCHKLDPVPDFIVNECMGFLKFIKKKSINVKIKTDKNVKVKS